jgi:nitrite reductase (NADH) small subunit
MVALGRVEEFPVGAFRILAVSGREIGVLRAADGRWHAFRNWCPHRGAPICRGKLTGTTLPSAPGALAWGLEASVLRCPWHGYEFDVASGRRPFVESRMQLRKYPVVVEGGVVHVDLSPRRSGDRSHEEVQRS